MGCSAMKIITFAHATHATAVAAANAWLLANDLEVYSIKGNHTINSELAITVYYKEAS